jgi:uroporphyrinogen decarboxylase
MRQAGRYLPEYRTLKEQHGFLKLVRTPELAAEVTLQPVQRFAFDAAILFCDILVVPEALGLGYHFRDGGGIEMEFALRSPEQIRALAPVAAVRERLAYAGDALRLVRRELGDATALLGFAGSPWTLAAYMVEGGNVGGAERLRTLADEDPRHFALLMEKLSDAVADFLRFQIECGADAVQIFDSWGALCGTDYERLSLQWTRRILAALPSGTPAIVFAKGMAAQAPAIAAAGAAVVSVDWETPLAQVRDALAAAGLRAALQGNLDPAVLETTPEETQAAVRAVLANMAGAPGHIFNLGHGIRPAAKLENVAALVETVRGAA